MVYVFSSYVFTYDNSVQIANYAAAVVVQKLDTATVSRDELSAFIQNEAIQHSQHFNKTTT